MVGMAGGGVGDRRMLLWVMMKMMMMGDRLG